MGDVLKQLASGEPFGSRMGGEGRPGGEALEDGEEVGVLKSTRGDGAEECFERVCEQPKTKESSVQLERKTTDATNRYIVPPSTGLGPKYVRGTSS